MKGLAPAVLCPHKFEDKYVVKEAVEGEEPELFQECPYCGETNIEKL